MNMIVQKSDAQSPGPVPPALKRLIWDIQSTVLPAGSGLLVDQPNHWEIVGALRGSVSRRIHDLSALRRTSEPRALRAAEIDVSVPRTASAVEVSNALTDHVSISVHVYGGDVTKLNARRIGGTSDDGRLLGYANSPNAPPYDILTIQTKILD